MSADTNKPKAGGYGKPPRHKQFTKGRSGNPKGRPKGTPNYATAFERALKERVVVNEAGERSTISKLEATMKQLVNKATQGDARATQQVLTVLQVLERDTTKKTPSLPITDTDHQVMQNLMIRIRALTPTPGDTDHGPHS